MQMNLAPIGIIHSPHQRAEGTPVQAALATGVRGSVEVFPLGRHPRRSRRPRHPSRPSSPRLHRRLRQQLQRRPAPALTAGETKIPAVTLSLRLAPWAGAPLWAAAPPSWASPACPPEPGAWTLPESAPVAPHGRRT
jgi:hypothetical protein